MHITLVGISHKTAPVAVRERFAFAADELPEALPKFGGAAVLVSTCNRTEVYMIAHHAITPGPVIAVLRDLKSDVEAPDDVFYHKTGLDAARHLFRVAAGIESMVLGESEILGQVRSAFSAATAANTHNAVLSQLFHTAIRVGRKARSETGIGRHAVSISSTATKLAERTLGDLPARSVLVVGAGEAGKLTARSLVERGVKKLLVTSRTAARAKELAKDLGGRPVPFNKLGATMAGSDIVITSSAAPDFLIGQAEVQEATAHRNGRPLLLIDIAVPRDVDPAVRGVSNVQLYDMDDLQALVEKGRNARQQEVANVERIVDEGIDRFRTWVRDRGVVPTVAALREGADSVRRAELEKTFQRHGDLTEKQRRSIEAMSSALVKKLLHEPIVRLKSDDGERYVVPVRELFNLDEERDQDSPPEGS
ncbi:MAG: glutamyl-tRNA reductase [Chloroflexi bacterium]|nr:glutamyl-tRNA reductase [Chloroflexota bacterium]MCH8008122.1 glutamyl-tRNA reductase [Chloroflexota bacterium]